MAVPSPANTTAVNSMKRNASGSAAELKQQTGTDSLEAAFLSLTGTTIRDERADSADQLRQVARMWSGNKR